MEEFSYKGYTVEINNSYYAEDPTGYAEWKFAIWSRRYSMGNVDTLNTDPESWVRSLVEEFKPRLAWKVSFSEAMDILKNYYLVEPLGLFDHSGVLLYRGSGAHAFDPGGWDSGHAGWALLRKSEAVANRGLCRFTKNVEKRAKSVLESELEAYNQYLRGEVYEYGIRETERYSGCFFGADHEASGLLDCAKEAVDFERSRLKRAWFDRLKVSIREKVPLEHRADIKETGFAILATT